MRRGPAGADAEAVQFTREQAQVGLARARWRRALRRGGGRRAAAAPVVLAVLATVALASVSSTRTPVEAPAATPVANADGLPDEPRLAFTSDHVTMLARRDPLSDSPGTFVTKLFGPFFNDAQPAAAGGRLAFVGYRTDQGERPGPYQSDGDIFVLDPRSDGPTGDGVQRNVDDFVDAEPAAAPPGTSGANADQIAYATRRGDNWDIYRVPATGTGAPQPLVTGPGDDRHPSFSPDGTQIAFSSTRDDPAGDLYIRAADGTVRRLTTDPAADTEPVWSPDGTRIAFTTSRFGRPDHVAVLNLADGAVTDLVRGRSPAWSPESAEIAFVDTVADRLGDVYLVPATGGAPVAHSVEPGRSEDHPTYRTVRGGVQIIFAVAKWGTDDPAAAVPDPPPPSQPGVGPTPVNRTADPGDTFPVGKVVNTPPIPPNPDVVLLVDTTGSMGTALANVRTNLSTLIGQLRAAQPSTQLAVASYRDEEDGAELFRVHRSLTPIDTDANVAAVQAAVNGLTAGGGGESINEAWINALFQVSSGAIAFRPDSSRILVLVGDAASHDPSAGHSLSEATAALQAARVRVLGVAVNGSGSGRGLDSRGQATAVTGATGGRLVDGNADQITAAILDGLRNLTATVTQRNTCDPGLSVSFDRSSVTVPSGQSVNLNETVSVASDAAQGTTLRCTVEFLINGAPAGPAFMQHIVVTVNQRVAAAEIRAVDYDGSAPAELVNDPRVFERDPTWAPDGRRLAFETEYEIRGSEFSFMVNQIGVADHDGRNPKKDFIAVPGFGLHDPAWSPDGRFIAVSEADTEGPRRASLVIYDVTGATPVRRGVLPCTPYATPVPQPLWRFKPDPSGDDRMTETQCFDMEPAWAPDSRTIAFSRGLRIEADWFVGRIFAVGVTADGNFTGTPRQVTAATNHAERLRIRSDQAPTWSPDGGSIGYSEWTHELPGEAPPNVFTALVTIRANGTAPRRLVSSETNDDLMDFDKPAWSPDGLSIAFSAMVSVGPVRGDWRPGGYDIHAINIDGTGLRAVYVQPGNDTDPDFQPRADLIARIAPNPPGILIGQRSVVTLSLVNAGHHRATGVFATLTVPAGLTAGAIRFRQPPGVTLTGPGCVLATLRCEFDQVPGRVTVPIELEVTGTVQGMQPVTGTVGARQVDPDPRDNTARTAIAVDTADIAVSVTATPVPAFVGGDAVLVRYVVDNEGTGSTGPVAFTATLPPALPVRGVQVTAVGGPVPACPDPVEGCDLGPFPPTRVVTIEVTLGPDVPLVSAVVGLVEAPASSGDPADNTAEAPVDVRGPTLAVTPRLGKPGFVPHVIGIGFPARARIMLKWDRGVTARRTFVEADENGNFRVPMIVFHRDVRGPRVMVATHAAAEANPGPRFGPVRAAPYLVVTPSDQPDNWLYRR